MPSRRAMSASERAGPEASSSNHTLERATAFSSAGSTFLGRSSSAAMIIRVSTPRLLILSGTKRDRLTMLLVCTPEREQGTSILSVTNMPSSRSSALSMPSTRDAAASVSSCSRWKRFDADSRLLLHQANRSRTSQAFPTSLRDRSEHAPRQSPAPAQAAAPKDASLFGCRGQTH